MEDGSGGGCLVSAKTSHLERVGERDPILTLADFEVPLPLHCGHCDRRLPKSTRIEQFICAHAKVVEDEQTEMGKKVYQLQKPYVVAACPKCRLLTPFMLEPS